MVLSKAKISLTLVKANLTVSQEEGHMW